MHYLKNSNPLVKLVNNTPWCCHTGANKYCGVHIVLLCQGELKEVGVGNIPIEHCMIEKGVIFTIIISHINVTKLKSRPLLRVFISL